MLNYILPILIAGFAAVSGYAASERNTLVERQQIKAGQGIEVSEIARKADGSINYMDYDSAAQFCADQGKRLPTIRELAQMATKMGSAGISETAKIDYYQVSAKNGDGTIDAFYFNYIGYKLPETQHDIWRVVFWSSSVDTEKFYFHWKIAADSGGASLSNPRYEWGGVLCTSGL